jgi:enoyl-CoA hydratase/carnithine racemase
MSGGVSFERAEEGIQLIRLARSEARNALTFNMIRTLNSILDDTADDPGRAAHAMDEE